MWNKRINRYLSQWNAVGFRAAFMLHEPEWLSALNIQYDSSTFDTDPFEPQSDGIGTIFPTPIVCEDGHRYVELPYTLVQDFNLFIILQEKSIQVWKDKLDWIVEKGGMALLDTHPDYMHFKDGKPHRGTYPLLMYQEFLQYVKSKYSNDYWHATPRQISDYVANSSKDAECAMTGLSKRFNVRRAKTKRIWIDLDI
ncbi:MAG: hypothetical protein L7F78_26040, partial [Syntrophales bacterium LBB04]|nr:hypothetical protein [Syntrophales bacterium LBB04]